MAQKRDYLYQFVREELLSGSRLEGGSLDPLGRSTFPEFDLPLQVHGKFVLSVALTTRYLNARVLQPQHLEPSALTPPASYRVAESGNLPAAKPRNRAEKVDKLLVLLSTVEGRGKSQVELAFELRVDPSYVSRLLSDPRHDRLKELASIRDLEIQLRRSGRRLPGDPRAKRGTTDNSVLAEFGRYRGQG
jgi:hypothetical protein